MIISPYVTFMGLYSVLLIFSYQEYKSARNESSNGLVLSIIWSISGVVAFCWLVVTITELIYGASTAFVSLTVQSVIAVLLLFFSYKVAVYFKRR